MNLVGKILVVLILVMSLFFAAMTMAVYATHKNWKEVVEGKEGLSHQLTNARLRNEELKKQKEDLEKELKAVTDARNEALAKLENDLEDKKTKLAELQKKEADLDQERRTALAQVGAAEGRLKDLDAQLKQLESSIAQAKQDRDKNFEEVVRLTDAVNQAAGELKRAKDRSVRLAEEYAKAKAVLTLFNLKPDPAVYADKPPAGVPGQILSVTGDNLVEISVGEDDGVRKGHQLEVYRPSGGGSKYVGKIEVIESYPERAVAKILPNFRQAPVEKGDRVTSLTLLGAR